LINAEALPEKPAVGGLCNA